MTLNIGKGRVRNIENAGFVEYELEAVDFPIHYPSVEAWWATSRSMSIRAGRAQVDDPSELLAALADAAREWTGDDGSLAVRIAGFPAAGQAAVKERVNAIALAPVEDFRHDSDLFGEGSRNAEAIQRQIVACKSIDKLVADSENPDFRLKKSLGPWSLTALGVGGIIGSGIFVLTGLDKIVEASLMRAMPDWLVTVTTRL